MAKYMIEASYTQDGVKGLFKEGGTGRRTAIETAAKGLVARWSRSTTCSARTT